MPVFFPLWELKAQVSDLCWYRVCVCTLMHIALVFLKHRPKNVIREVTQKCSKSKVLTPFALVIFSIALRNVVLHKRAKSSFTKKLPFLSTMNHKTNRGPPFNPHEYTLVVLGKIYWMHLSKWFIMCYCYSVQYCSILNYCTDYHSPLCFSSIMCFYLPPEAKTF